MSKVLAGEMTILSVKISSTVTPIAAVTEIDGFELGVGSISTTHLGATQKSYRASGQPDPGKVTFKIELDPSDATHVYLRGKAATPTPLTPDEWTLTYADGNTTPAKDDWHGFVTKYKVTGMSEDSNLMAELEIQNTDIPVFTAGVP